MSDQFCPLRSVGMNDGNMKYCVKEDCAWWRSWYNYTTGEMDGECVVISIWETYRV